MTAPRPPTDLRPGNIRLTRRGRFTWEITYNLGWLTFTEGTYYFLNAAHARRVYRRRARAFYFDQN